jgi:osmoprotectant transport system substrate-binding protein
MAMRRLMAAAAAAVLVLSAGCGGDGGGDASKRETTTTPAPRGPLITIGTKNFPEQFVLGELYAQALRARGFRVRLKSNVGASEIVDRALTAGSLDMYPEYTGVVLSELAGDRRRPASERQAYERAKAFQEKRGFTMLAMTPFSDQNALAVTPSFARSRGLRSVADLRKLAGVVEIGAPPEFRTRFEGLTGLRQLYGLDRTRVKVLKIGEQYPALDDGTVKVANVFTTDGQLVGGKYELLADPRALFAFQNVAPVIKRSLARANPRMVRVIDAVSAKLTTEAMRSMNAAVVQRGEKPAAVARRFLERAGLAGG